MKKKVFNLKEYLKLFNDKEITDICIFENHFVAVTKFNGITNGQSIILKKYEKLTKKKTNNLIKHIKKQFHMNDEKDINPVFKHDSSATRIIIVNDGINRTITLRKFTTNFCLGMI